MNASTRLRLSRGHRARAAANKLKVDGRYVTRIHIRIPSRLGRRAYTPSQYNVKVLHECASDYGNSQDFLLELSAGPPLMLDPSIYTVVSSERRRIE